MPLDTYTTILWIVEVIVYLFHFSMLVLMIALRKNVFQGPFYRIFKIVLFADLMSYITITVTQKLRLISFILEIFKDNMFLITGALVINNYVTSMQFIGHLLLAFNRFTIIWFPISYQRIWEKPWSIFLLIIIPFLPICWRLTEPIIFKFAADGTVAAAVFVNSDIAKISNILSSTVYFTTTVLAAILNVASFFKFIFYKNKQVSGSNIKEKHLLYVSFVIFLSQLLRITYNVNGIFFAANFELISFFNFILPLLNDAFAWSGSISILFLSSSTRKAYKLFYSCNSNALKTNSHASRISKVSTIPKRFPTKISTTF